jgi:hypothetical protein
MSELSEKRTEKSFSDRVIEKSVELFGFTPDEKSDKNLEWMREHGYLVKQNRVRHSRSGI